MLQLNVQDPSGETRRFALTRRLVLGRSPESHIQLRDPSLPNEVAEITSSNENTDFPAWVRLISDVPNARIGDLAVRDAGLPEGVPFFIGETRVTLFREIPSESTPKIPSQTRPWITCSEAGRAVLWRAKKIAESPLSVYIHGETGTGKDVIAHLVHKWSPRSGGPFVPINCGAFSPSLAESELFGHEKGSFTGAVKNRVGALLQAHGGTLFLDEVADLSMDLQVKLLRFLENGEIRPVGADRLVHADVRIICATHKPLQTLVQNGGFRQDLYYRIASTTLEISPLRDRPEDIRTLAISFAEGLGKRISPKALQRLLAHTWPGNVRELRHVVEHACGTAGSFVDLIRDEHLEFKQSSLSPDSNFLAESKPSLSLVEMERSMMLRALRISNGNRSQAANLLGIARSTLFEMLKRHRVPGPKAKLNSKAFG